MTSASETTFDVLAYLRRLLRQLPAAALVAALTAAGTFALLHRTPPSYTATSTLIFQPPVVTSDAQATQQSTNVQAQMRNYRQLAGSQTFINTVAAKLDGEPAGDALATTLGPVWVPGSLMMTFPYTTTDEQKAITVSNAAATAFKEQMPTWTAGQSETMKLSVSTVLPATAPATKVVPSLVKQALTALAAGLVLGLATAMLLDARRHRAGATAARPAVSR